MANRYIIKGATYNGDGTSSALATVAGGVGAWNDITIFEGTTPPAGSTLPAGTTVFIRSKDAAGADITLSYAASKTLGQAAATETSPINWVVDAGVVWPGISSVVTYNITTEVSLTTRDHNHLFATNSNLIFLSTYANFGVSAFVIFGKSSTKDLKIDMSAQTSSWGGYIQSASGSHQNLWIRSYNRYFNLFKVSSPQQQIVLISPKIELLNAANTSPVLSTDGGYAGNLLVFGGEIFGAGAAEGVTLLSGGNNMGACQMFGLKYPRGMPLAPTTSIPFGCFFSSNGSDGVLGNSYVDYFCVFDSRNDGFYPTLNATLETSENSGWSYKLYPYRTTVSNQAQISTSKVFTQSPAPKTVTLEILWPVAMTSPKSDVVYMNVQYTDNATGLKVNQTTRAFDGSTLATSTAGWSATTYGATAFAKYKLALTTSGSVKQDTEVMVTFFSSPRSMTSADIIFVDPDPTFS